MGSDTITAHVACRVHSLNMTTLINTQHMLYMTPQSSSPHLTSLNTDAITHIIQTCHAVHCMSFKSTQHHRFICSMKSVALSLLSHGSKTHWYSSPWGGEGPVLGALKSHSQERLCVQLLRFPLLQSKHLPRSTRLRSCPARHNLQFKGCACSSATYGCVRNSVLRR